jgi:hypothetical protein
VAAVPLHFMRNALAHAGKNGRRVVSAFIATAFAQNEAEAARRQWRSVADQFRPKMPKPATFMDAAEADVLAYGVRPLKATGSGGGLDSAGCLISNCCALRYPSAECSRVHCRLGR